jgi:hypothetical protein
MITQYTRVLADPLTGEITNVTSQDYPFVDGWNPVEPDNIASLVTVDFEIETRHPDADFGVGRDQKMIRGREIIENLEIVGGQPQVKAGAAPAITALISGVSSAKSIQESDIRGELAVYVRNALSQTGTTEAELLASMRAIDRTIGASLEDLNTVQLIRLKKLI